MSDFDPGRHERPSVLDTPATRAVDADAEIGAMDEAALIAGIQTLRKERNAILLAHNYQIPEVQDLADFVGDSLQLSQQAAATDADYIVFCGVEFMAETAAILCPNQTVLLPDSAAGCSLADMATVEQLRKWKTAHPGAITVAYINTHAAIKAEVDYVCTSGNAKKVIDAIPEDKEILFLPDMFLGAYLREITGRNIHLWLGECHVHAGIRPEHIHAQLDAHPDADLLLHPECGCVSQCLLALAQGDLPADRTFVLGTGGMLRHAKSCPAEVDIIGTEIGLIHRLRKENPDKQFIPVKEDAICEYMKTITLPKVYRALRDLVYEVEVPAEVARKARRSIDRMLELA